MLRFPSRCHLPEFFPSGFVDVRVYSSKLMAFSSFFKWCRSPNICWASIKSEDHCVLGSTVEGEDPPLTIF